MQSLLVTVTPQGVNKCSYCWLQSFHKKLTNAVIAVSVSVYVCDFVAAVVIFFFFRYCVTIGGKVQRVQFLPSANN